MPIELPELPFAPDALEPFASRESVAVHYGKHHKSYHDTLNVIIEGTRFQSMSLSDIVRQADGEIFTNAAQAWNHNFYWQCLSPDGRHHPTGELLEAIETSFRSFQHFQREFERQAMSVIGSGWTWLVENSTGGLGIINTRNAETPKLDLNTTPLLTIDVWEHAYYVDYHDQKGDYIRNFWGVVNWDFVQQNYATKTYP